MSVSCLISGASGLDRSKRLVKHDSLPPSSHRFMGKMKNSILKWCITFWVVLNPNGIAESLEYGTRVDDFIQQFTSLFNQYPLKYRENDLDTQYLNALKQHFPGAPDSNNNLYDGPNAPPYGYPPASPFRPRPPLHPPTNDIGPNPPLGPFPLPPQRPLYRPPLGALSQTSLITALNSIAKYDDLHCVPRLLCEVTSGSMTGNKKKGSEEASPVPFLSRDGVIALLTVLNFVDDSPILLFLRAAFLGYSSKGDTKVCLNSYPLCPKDPDQLVNYLNNHNGGFFRFFNQQLQHQPQYSAHLKKYLNDTDKEFRDSKLTPRLPKLGFTSRILNDPIDIVEIRPHGKIAYLGNTRLPTRNEVYDQAVFASQHKLPPSDLAYDNNEQNSVFPSRTAKKISFPGSVTKSFTANVMIFPDRTGTGNLILSEDPAEGQKISFVGEAPQKIKSKVKFLNDNQRYGKKLRFPVDED